MLCKMTWRDGLLILDGLWVFASPWLLPGTPRHLVNLNHMAVGAAVVVLGAARPYLHRSWGTLVGVVLGTWLALSPLMGGYVSHLSLALSDFVAAAWIVLLSCWPTRWDSSPKP